MTSLTRIGLRTLSRMAGSTKLDALKLRKPTEQVLYHGTKAGFKAVTAANRAFKSVKNLGSPQRLPKRGTGDLFDLAPTEDQQMLQEAARTFAMEQLREAAGKADMAYAAPPELLAQCAELGITSLGIPEALGGMGTERSAVTNVLIAEAMAEGDMGLAFAALAPSAVSTALVLWGNAEQQADYLGAFTGENVPAAALAIQEPTPLFDPFELKTRAVAQSGGYVINGVKSMVPLAASAELFIVAAHIEGKGPALFVIESSTKGLSIEEDRAMGLRAAGTARLKLDAVSVSAKALLAEGAAEVYRECIQLSRLAWCALATGCAQGVLDFIVPYVNERQAFGEPISHRQSVAFAVSNMSIELNAMRLLTWRAASLVDADVDFFEAAALARRLCTDKGMQIGSDGVQLLGGHGFVTEYPVERWYRDLRAVGVMEGGLLI
ncbi:acyl-CoA dehydrogenase family protein [Aquabacterium sp. CECT 9606]|uniref:acyl-CoA dehydrogenase family protein n=1 Tax=Aquabacterium sp. CECT 9606 TaxID=2845822 RepID=UPI001E40B775|nr:acyl-CoA dehydrogenase family protein [Aquabacterium sp. CECT 9606]CAH0351439.1 Acryloyl-CoA reductase (NADH) [Aquabacterium sp. CECT 9606]